MTKVANFTSTSMVQIKGSIQDSVWTPEFDMKNLKKADWPKHDYNNKDEVNSPSILSYNNQSDLFWNY